MNRRRAASVFFIILLLTNLISASEKYKPSIEDPILESWRWKHFSELDGKGVRCIEEDKNHNMWFGVDKGIIRYDGLNWKMYETKDGLASSPVISLLSSSNGKLFAGSIGGISVYDNNKWTPLFFDSTLTNLKINELIELKDKSIICATSLGLIHFSGITENSLKNLTIYTNKEGAAHFSGILPKEKIILFNEKNIHGTMANISSVVQDKDERIWIAMGYSAGKTGKILTGIFNDKGILDKIKLKYSENENMKLYNGTRLFYSDDGTVWNVTSEVGLGMDLFKNGNISKISLNKKFGSDDIYSSIIQSSDNSIFLGGLGHFFVYKNNRWKEYKHPSVPIPSSTRILLFEDSHGDIWAAGKQNEVFLLNYAMNNWATYLDLNFQAETGNDVRWFIDINGKVIKNKDDQWISYSEKDGLMSHPVSVFISSREQIWAIGSHNGIASAAYLKENRWIKQLYPKLSWGIDYRGAYEDLSGSLWFGCNIDIDYNKGQKGGIIKYPNPLDAPNNYIHFLLPQREVGVYGIGQSKDRLIWVAGVNTCYFDGKKWKLADYPKEFKYHTDCIHTSNDNTLWVGSRNYGLFQFNGESWKNYTIEDGLKSNSITAIHSTSDSTAWVATSKDICYFDGTSWTTNVFPKELIIFKEGGEIRMDNAGNLWINKSSRKWYRRVLNNLPVSKLKEEGYKTVFYHLDPLAPETRVLHYEKEVSQIGNTTITWTGNDPFGKTEVDKLQYSFRIDGNKWMPFSKQTSHFFYQLPWGYHTFEVRSRDLDFNIDQTPAKITFKVLYPFYLRPAFIAIFLIFLSISIFLLISVIKKSKELRQAKKETDEILRNIKQGLFLLDKKYYLGSQYSAFLKEVFKENNLANCYFIDLLKDKISDEDIESIESYLDIIFRPDLDPSILTDLNPFNEIMFNYPDGSQRYFSFRFRRVTALDDNSIITNIIVVVQDITEQVILGNKLKNAQEDADRKMNWLLDLIHVEPSLLQEFLISTENELMKIFDILDNIDAAESPKTQLENIYRSMHLLKGNAGLLEINSFAKEAHYIEDAISELQKKETITREDFQHLQNDIEKISDSIKEVKNLLNKLSSIHNQMRTKRGFEKEQLNKSLEDLVQKISKDEEKSVKLLSKNFNLNDFPYKMQLVIKEILVQFIKNSVIHGIEPQEEREKTGKAQKGTIEISSYKNKQGFGFTVRDDGRGLQIDKIKEKLIKSNKYSPDEINSWTDEDIYLSIFLDGISTAKKVSINAGRGVGLSAVKEKIESAGGKIKIETEKNKFCEFTVRFPAEADKQYL